MQTKRKPAKRAAISLAVWAMTALAMAAEDAGRLVDDKGSAEPQEQRWNWHVQNTDIVDWHPGFPARYSGPNSLSTASDVRETVSLDLLAGARLWRGAEFHLDGLMWQGFGFSKTVGVEGFPNGEAFRFGTAVPNVVLARVFIRQIIGLGGEQQRVGDDDLHLAGRQDVSRITLTLGKFSAKDIFDNNAYANDPRTQFMNWSLMANEAWDYPADSLGFTTGFAAELNQPGWAVRYGFFQVPRVANGVAQDQAYLDAWAMVTEFERRCAINDHPGAVRVLAFLNRAHMGSYRDTLDNPALGADIRLTRDYRYKFGFGLNVEQELSKGIGAFMRLGWSDGMNEAWMFSDVDHAASLGLSVNGGFWHRTNDTVGVAGALNGISSVHRDFFAAGGTGILAGDGKLTYGLEQLMETYYDFQIWKTIHATLDYQFIANPAFNRDRGPVSVFTARLHWSF
jgi:high affinity Mn2+ porin